MSMLESLLKKPNKNEHNMYQSIYNCNLQCLFIKIKILKVLKFHTYFWSNI